MPYARNALDGTRIYFDDDGGEGTPVVFHGGLLDSVEDVRESIIARSLPRDEFRLICADHRGLGRSDKPHDADAYAMELRAADAVAVLDEVGVDRAHFIGTSWGGRLVFGVGQHAPGRTLSLVAGGQQPYAWPDSPLTRVVVNGLARAQTEGMEALVGGFESFWEVEFPEPMRTRWLDNDPAALQSAVRKVLAEGPVSERPASSELPCLIFMGAGDADFLEGARRAADEIPNAELVLLDEADHYAAHISQDERVLEAILRTMRSAK